MRLRFGGLVFGGLLFLGGSVIAGNIITNEYTTEYNYNYPVSASYEETRAAYADNLSQAAVDSVQCEMFQERLEKMNEDTALDPEKSQDLARKLERRQIMLEHWNDRQQDLLNQLVELRIEERLKQENTQEVQATPEILAELEERLERKNRQLKKALKKLYRQASRQGDYAEIIQLANDKTERQKQELAEIANQYVDVYTQLHQQSAKPNWTTSEDIKTLVQGGYMDLGGKSPKDISRVEAAEKTAILLKALENGKYTDISDENLRAASRLRTDLSNELEIMGYFDDETAQLQAETQAAWQSAIRKKQKLTISDEVRIDGKKDSGDVSNESHLRLRNRLYADYNIDNNWHAVAMLESTKYLSGNRKDSWLGLERYYLTGNIGEVKTTAGVFGATMAEGNIYDSKFKGIMLEGGAPVKLRFRYGSNNVAHNVYTFTAEYKEPGKYSLDGGFHHFGMNNEYGGSSRNIWYANVHVPLGNRFDLGLMYLNGHDSRYSQGGSNGFVGTLSYGADKTWVPGNTSYYAKYYYQPRSTYVQHEMNGTADTMDGFKGWGLGIMHTFTKNITASIEFDHLKEIVSDRQNNTIWAAVSYFFDL